MPLARIDLAEGKSAECRRTIGEKDDRFQVSTEHPAQDFILGLPASMKKKSAGPEQETNQ